MTSGRPDPAGAPPKEKSENRRTLCDLRRLLLEGAIPASRLAADPRVGARRLAAVWERRAIRSGAEEERLAAMFELERAAWRAGTAVVAGIDEAGRGPLAGPVVAAAVAFPRECRIAGLRDSKQLRPDARARLLEAIIASGAAIGVGRAEVPEIDRLNIVGATRLAWLRAFEALDRPPALVLLDGNLPGRFPARQVTVVGGDATCASIAAASIVAKVNRDGVMAELDLRYPGYGFASHKGYATSSHFAALRRWGPTAEHRSSFLPQEFRAGLF